MARRPPLLLLALCWTAGAAPLPDGCEQELNRIKDLLQVSCAGRGLEEPPAGLPPGTGILLLSENRLARLSLAAFAPLRNLSELELARNGLAELSADGPLPSLQQLGLAHNALRSLPALRGLPRLERLALAHNHLQGLPDGGFRALPSLQDLELQGNQLRSLAPGAFAGLALLRDLDLSGNRLEALPSTLLAGLDALRILRLEHNRLRALPDGFFQEHLLAYVYLHDNPWRCDCRLRYLRAWIDDNEPSVYTRMRGRASESTESDAEGVLCSAPAEHQGSPVMHFQAACGDRGDGEGEDPPPPSTAASPTSTLGPPGTAPHGLPAAEATSTARLPSRTPTPTGIPRTSPATPLRDFPTSPPSRHLTSTLGPPPTEVATSTAHLPSRTPTPTGIPRTSPATPQRDFPTSPPSTAASPTSTLGPPPTEVATSTTYLPSRTPTPTGIPRTSPATPQRDFPTSPPSTAASLTSTLGPPPTEVATSTARHPSGTPTPTSGPGRGSSPATPRTSPGGTGIPRTSPTTPLRDVPSAPASGCLCPAVPVGALRAPMGQRSAAVRAGLPGALCCALRLALYAACLALLGLPVLLGGAWAVLSSRLPAPHRPPPARGRELQRAVASGAGRPGIAGAAGSRLYYVCKEFRVAPASHVAWLLISLPGPSSAGGGRSAGAASDF